MPLTNKRIAELAERRGARAQAVENFLGSLASMRERDARVNLEADARSYRWNAATVAAIRAGLKEAYAPAKPAGCSCSRGGSAAFCECRQVAPQPRAVRTRRLSPADSEWQREQAMQLGMGLGVEAYNDAMGWGSDE